MFMKKLLTLLLFAFTILCHANEPIKLYIQQPPGGLSDTLARRIQKEAIEKLNVNIVVVNKPGADGLIALREFLNDNTGNHLLLAGTTLALKLSENESNLELYKNLSPMMYVSDIHTIFVTSKKSKITTWDQFLAETKKRHVTMGVSSISQKFIVERSLQHIPNITIVPFPGDTPTLGALMSDSIDVANLTSVTAITQIQGSLLNGIAATHNNTANIPIPKELSIKTDIDLIATGFFMKKSTPLDIQQRYQKLFSDLLSSKEIIEFYKQNNLVYPKDISALAIDRHMKNVQDLMSKKNVNNTNR